MATIEAYETKAGTRYRVRYRKPDRRQTDKRGFKTKRDAKNFAATVETSKLEGTYVDPSLGRVTVGTLGEAWLKRKSNLKPSSLQPLKAAWANHVEPRWGTWRVSDITKTDVEQWVSELDRSPTVIIRAVGVLAGILDGMVESRAIPANPARKIGNMPRKTRKDNVYLSHEQVDRFARRAGRYRAVILIGCYLGLRWGEITGLRVGDFDPLRRRIHVRRNVVLVGGKFHEGTPKGREKRSVPVPGFLIDTIALECRGKARGDLIFPGDRAQYMYRPRTDAGWFGAAREAAGVPAGFTPHDMRHTAASLAVQSGAHVKAVQRMLGHRSAAQTLDVYADLFDADLDQVAESLDRARREAL